MDRARLVRMQHDAICTLERRNLDLGLLDRAQVHARLDPTLEEDIVEAVAGAHHDVGGFGRLFGLRDWCDFDSEQALDLISESLAVNLGGAEAADRLDLAPRP